MSAMDDGYREHYAEVSRLHETLTRWEDKGIEALSASDIDYLRDTLTSELMDRADKIWGRES